jgi:ADP-heptose:LPS heptosyltransferase
MLDKGADPDEIARVDTLVAKLGRDGFQVVALDERRDQMAVSPEVGRGSLVTWQGGIGRFAALIAGSAAYIGYDSAGQHIAAALGVPTIDIFTGFTSPRMPKRWSPYGPAAAHMLVLEAGEPYTSARLEAIIDDVLTRIPLG